MILTGGYCGFLDRLLKLNASPQQYGGYYNAHQYPHYSPQHPAHGFGGYGTTRGRQYPIAAPRSAPKKSYNDLCRLVNLNGFSNPGGVPKCIRIKIV